MTKNQHHTRRSIRLRGYDYTLAGAYFFTTVTDKREPLLGTVSNGKMISNPKGVIVEATWFDLTNHIDGIELGDFVVMPNHVHGVVVIHDIHSAKPVSLPEVIRQFKTYSARRINELRDTPGRAVWQRNYYEHIIRNEREWENIHCYIVSNPAEWASDEENPEYRGDD